MHRERYLQLVDKANNYILRVQRKEYTADNKAAATLLYQIDTMIYSLSGIDTAVWQGFLKTFREAKTVLRTNSKDESVKKTRYLETVAIINATLGKYIVYLQTTFEA